MHERALSMNTVAGPVFQNWDMLFMHAPIGIFITTPNGRYLAANLALARMYGYASPEDLMDSIRNIGQQAYVDPVEREEYKRILE